MNSQYLKWFREIELSLWYFFRLFGDLCSQCAEQTLIQVRNNERKNKQSWCCCMIDNQVHDYWEPLNKIQSKFDNNWHSKIKNIPSGLGKNRMPGNGPCVALGINGCSLHKHRPPTCSTQLCEKMIFVLNELKITNSLKHAPLQIENIIILPDIVNVLYGVHKGKKVKLDDVKRYLKNLGDFRNKFALIDRKERKKVIDQSIRFFMLEGGKL